MNTDSLLSRIKIAAELATNKTWSNQNGTILSRSRQILYQPIWATSSDSEFISLLTPENLLATIDKFSDNANNDWINLSISPANLPRKHSRVLVYFPTQSTSPMDAIFDGADFFVDGINRTEAVTHWRYMSLPLD